MNLFIAVLSTLFSSLGDIFFKKSLKYNINLWNNDFLGQILPLSAFIFAYHYFEFHFDTTLYLSGKILFFIFLSLFFYTIGRYLHAKIFRVEKITHLLPYENLSKIFTIIFSFYLFSDISTTTFFITLFTIFVIILFSIDFKNITFSKNILTFSASHLFLAIGNLIVGYILLAITKGGLGVTGYSFITTYLVMGVVVFFIPFLILKWYSELKNIQLGFYLYRGTSGFFSWFSWFLGLVVISYLGLSISVLLSFLGIFSTLFFAFFILREIPRKKDIFLTIIILTLISLGFYFK